MILRASLFAFAVLLSVAATAGDFTPGVAINDAAKISDPESTKFFTTVVYPGKKKGKTINAIAGALMGAEKDRANIAFIGEDFKLTAELLQITLEMFPANSLKGVTVLYVGEVDHLDDMTSAATAAGAVFRATKYSGAR
jgi:hypothetical protein